MIQPLWRIVWRFFKKLGLKLPYVTAILLLQAYSEKTSIKKYICTPVFIAALFATVRTWKQPRCPWTDEWVKKMWYIHTMEYYSAIKRNKFEIVGVKYMNLEYVKQSEVSQKEKNKYCILMLLCGI